MKKFEQILIDEILLKRLFFETYNFIEFFKKKKIVQLSSHRKYNYKIKLKDDVNVFLEHYSLYVMFLYKLQKIKKYLKENLTKDFIFLSKVSYVLLIFFAQKVDDSLRFCVNY